MTAAPPAPSRATARNVKAFERGQRLRSDIEATYLRLAVAAGPLARSPTGLEVWEELTCWPVPSRRTVRWHMKQIRCHRGNSSPNESHPESSAPCRNDLLRL